MKRPQHVSKKLLSAKSHMLTAVSRLAQAVGDEPDDQLGVVQDALDLRRKLVDLITEYDHRFVDAEEVVLS